MKTYVVKLQGGGEVKLEAADIKLTAEGQVVLFVGANDSGRVAYFPFTAIQGCWLESARKVDSFGE